MRRKDEANQLTYPQNLVAEVFGYGEDAEPDAMGIAATLGEAGTVACAMLAARLTAREQDMVTARFRDGLTLEEIGVAHGIAGERTRQVIAKAMRKMRRPEARDILRMGVYSWMTDRIRKAADDRAQVLFQNYKNEFTVEWERTHAGEIEADSKRTMVAAYTVEELDLSVRAYNCLKRASLNTVGDIIRAAADDPEWWRKVRNLGSKSYREIAGKLDEFGVHIMSSEEAWA